MWCPSEPRALVPTERAPEIVPDKPETPYPWNSWWGVLGGKSYKLSKYFVSSSEKRVVLESVGESSSHFYFVKVLDGSETSRLGT